MGENIEIKGIKCDSCDYHDDSVEYKDYPSWINKHCPKCNANLLTQEDFDSCEMMIEMSNNIADNVPMEHLEQMQKSFNDQGLSDSDLHDFVNNLSFGEIKDAFSLIKNMFNTQATEKITNNIDTADEEKLEQSNKELSTTPHKRKRRKRK